MAVFFKKKSSTEGESTNHRKVPERSNRVRVKNCFPFDCFSVLTDDNYYKKKKKATSISFKSQNQNLCKWSLRSPCIHMASPDGSTSFPPLHLNAAFLICKPRLSSPLPLFETRRKPQMDAGLQCKFINSIWQMCWSFRRSGASSVSRLAQMTQSQDAWRIWSDEGLVLKAKIV